MRLSRLRFLCLAACVLFLSACGLIGNGTEATTQPEEIPATETPTEGASTTPETIPVFIDSIRLLVLQSDPVQVDLTINGHLPDGCTVLETISQEQQESTIMVEVQARRDPNMPCTEALVPFNQTIPLEVADLPHGTYTVQVGEVSDSFTLGAAPEDSSTAPSGASIQGAVWHDYCDTLADGSPTAGCIDTGDGSVRADGLFGEGESRIIGVEITLSSGECPPDGTPATDIQLTTTRTDGTGVYLFGDLPAGPHCVAINAFSDINIGILPPGIWTAPRVTEISVNTTVELAPGEQKTNVDFGWDYQLAAATTTEQPDCTNKVSYVADVTIPDNTVLTPGQEFVKTWRLRNDGDCVWSTAYALEFVEGDPMGFTGAQPLAAAVQPGQEVDISVTLTAPNTPGTYRSDWQLSDEQGRFFGLGANANVSFYVQIVVQ